VLGEGDAAFRVLDQLLAGEAVVKVSADLSESLQNLPLFIDTTLPKLLSYLLFKIGLVLSLAFFLTILVRDFLIFTLLLLCLLVKDLFFLSLGVRA
jgi:hypothetical protein